MTVADLRVLLDREPPVALLARQEADGLQFAGGALFASKATSGADEDEFLRPTHKDGWPPARPDLGY